MSGSRSSPKSCSIERADETSSMWSLPLERLQYGDASRPSLSRRCSAGCRLRLPSATRE